MLISDLPTFDPNSSTVGDVSKADFAQFPQIEGVMDAGSYANAFSNLIGAARETSEFDLLKAGVAGSIDAPNMQSFARITQMPNAMTQGMVQWPDLPAASLKKIATENYVCHAIIQQRIADVMRYAQPSTHPWKPGWAIELREGNSKPSDADLKDIKDATRFVLGCNSEFGWDARKRDAAQLKSWRNFLAASVRDTMRYDGMAWWTDMDARGRVRAFKALPAANILLCTNDGYQGDPNIFACGVDEAGSVKHKFTRNDLTWVVRNERTDAEVANYGYSEISMTLRLIQGFSNAFDMNSDIFTRDAIPPGLLKLKGMWTQRQVEVISRIWMNLKRGSTKKWALPAIPIPKEGDIELLDMSRLTNNDAYYQDYVNMIAGLFCTIYQFPVHRLGYRISGGGTDTEPAPDQTSATLVDENDPGRAPLLNAIENSFNEYILWTRWPHLQLVFRGKDPKEDAREYEARKNASTFDEVRALSDRSPISECVPPAMRDLAELLGASPVDPNLAGVWQSIASAHLGAEAGPESEFTSTGDPKMAETHGHMSGVRRKAVKKPSE